MDRSVYQRMAQHEERHWWFRARREILAALIRRLVAPRPDCRLLEVGCGTGGNLALLRRFGEVDAYEYDEEARRIAHEKSGTAVRPCALPSDIDAPDGRYALVLLLDVLEHIGDDIGSLKSVAPKLAAGGHVLLTVPAFPWLWSSHDVAHHHFRRYTPDSLRRTADAAGLQVVRIGYFNTLLFPLVVATRLVKRLTRHPGSDDAMPGPAANALLRFIFGLERFLIGRVPMPFGSSIFMIAAPRRRESSPEPAAEAGVAAAASA